MYDLNNTSPQFKLIRLPRKNIKWKRILILSRNCIVINKDTKGCTKIIIIFIIQHNIRINKNYI